MAHTWNLGPIMRGNIFYVPEKFYFLKLPKSTMSELANDVSDVSWHLVNLREVFWSGPRKNHEISIFVYDLFFKDVLL